MITLAEFDAVLVEALPELATDRATYDGLRREDPEFQQSFFSYSFVPTLQAALDRNVEGFTRRAFALIEHLLSEGDSTVQQIVRDELLEYGPACEKWMRRAGSYLGPLASKAAAMK